MIQNEKIIIEVENASKALTSWIEILQIEQKHVILLTEEEEVENGESLVFESCNYGEIWNNSFSSNLHLESPIFRRFLSLGFSF